ncbi:NADPH-dependent F420 reductase [Gaoshiqia sediminis]|uniref:NAD(P)-binding domain-containing protein n=1 Tax=Gaoshiqia sediminis TaxID=2986998 RepID=A0AA41Y419_9BACT|nr:NAD(P)-binding domain-containing protein [Gaoshiqia sediminis]MCW0481494.1 NAD(P)-binding domain-containing protein [Gaoshiqia sediminis]
MRKRIGVLGSGIVARVLANGFLQNGYEVMMGSRDPKNLEDWLEQAGEKGSVGSFENAAHFGDQVVLAVKGSAAEFVLDLAGAANLHEKTVIDTCNPISEEAPENGVLRYFTKPNQSLMEHLQTKYSRIHFVKAFNSVGNDLMVNPVFREGKPTMFICGNNAQAKADVEKILEMFGWECEDMGGVQSARALEPLAILWCIPGFLRHEWRHAFKLLKK